METYHFQIAGIRFQIQVDWTVTVSDNFFPFLSSASNCWEERMHFSCSDDFPACSNPVSWNFGCGSAVLSDGRRCILHRLSENSLPYLMEIMESNCERVFCFRKSSNEMPDSMQKIFNEIGMEAFFLRHGCLILHSSLIRWNGKAILFSAPSGTGKSTQAELWRIGKNAEILNGDRAVLRQKEGRWYACGLPFAGSSNIWKNESAPICAIVMLSQGSDNQIHRMNPAQAFRKILPEISLRRRDSAFMEKGLDIIMNILQSIPVFHLACRPDQEAVELLHHTISHEVEP